MIKKPLVYFLASLIVFPLLNVSADLDEDQDGLSDIWELKFNAGSLAPSIDTDADGHNNLQESIAGTDPLDPESCFNFTRHTFKDGTFEVEWNSVEGKAYQARFGHALDSLTNEGTLIYGNGRKLTATFRPGQAPQVNGGITREVWNGIPGTRISDLVYDPVYQHVEPGRETLARLSGPVNSADDFGARIRGWLTPVQTQDYTFYVAASDQAELHLSTDDNPANAQRIARVIDASQPEAWHHSLFQKSTTIELIAGQRYYIEVLHKASSGNDHISVGWHGEDSTRIEVIDGAYLSPWIDASASQSGAWLSESGVWYVSMAVEDRDADADEVSSWEEEQVGALNPFFGLSAGGGGDKAALQLMAAFDSADQLNVVVAADSAYEKEGVPARFRVERTGSLDAMTILFSLGGNGDLTKGSANTNDYIITDGSGTPITNAVDLAFGANSVEVLVQPIADELNEVPETLTLTITPDAAYTVGATNIAAIAVKDAENNQGNQRLFVAYLGSENNAETSASGIGTVLLSGDNTIGSVGLSFSGLTSPQVAAHIHVSNPVSGPVVQGLPAGQVSDFEWTVRAAQFMTTDQEVLDRLFSGGLYVNVHSVNYPSGEIRGDLILTQGSTSFQVPDAPPGISVLTGNDLDRDIIRFLTQATFGPTSNSVEALRDMILDPLIGNGDRLAGMEAWIDQQMDTNQVPRSELLPFVQAATNDFVTTNIRNLGNEARRYGWYQFAVYGEDQLRQRMAFALSEIFVISDQDSALEAAILGMATYYDMLSARAFEAYEPLLMDVSMSPLMGAYLSHLRNRKETKNGSGIVVVSPDENYAREIMQLFSIGLVRLHPDGTIQLDSNGLPVPTYDNKTITEMAKVFTGFGFGQYRSGTNVVENTNFFRGNSNEFWQDRWLAPMKLFQNYHETREKVIADNVVIPSGLPAESDLQIVCQVLGRHRSTASFISRRLIQRFVTSNPSRGYLHRVTQAFTNSGGDLGDTIKAVLLDYEARELSIVSRVGHGKPKEPIIRMTAMMRAFNAGSNIPLSSLSTNGYPAAELAKFPANATRLRYRDHRNLGQVPHNAPTVFNFFVPDYSKPGKLGAAGLVSPEFQIATENQIVTFIDEIYDAVFGRLSGDGSPPGYSSSDDDIYLDYTPLVALHDAVLAGGTELSAATAVIDYLDLLFNAGSMKVELEAAPTPNARSIMIEAVENTTGSLDKVRNAVYIIANSPQAATQR
jgi:uncharacterized protein (DUF1800 family)